MTIEEKTCCFVFNGEQFWITFSELLYIFKEIEKKKEQYFVKKNI